MPKSRPNNEFIGFGQRLVELLQSGGQPRRGAGAYLNKRYGVANVTANAWLNGEYRPEPDLARRIADDHGSTFDELYFGPHPKIRGATNSQEIDSARARPRKLPESNLIGLSAEAQALVGLIASADASQSVSSDSWKHLAGVVRQMMASSAPPKPTPRNLRK